MIALETGRLRLEPLVPRHADSLYSIYSEPGVRRFLITRPESRADFDRIFGDAIGFASTHGMWALVLKETSTLIGRVGFFGFGEEARPELAVLLSERFWGAGLATEGASACLHHAFAHHDWPEVVAVVRPANTAAVRVLEKLGMVVERTIGLRSAPAVIYKVSRRAFRDRTERLHGTAHQHHYFGRR